MAVDPFENWVAVGTSLGYHVIWDMRFQLPIRKWQHTGHGGKRMTIFYNIRKVTKEQNSGAAPFMKS